jgi:hypothetical protein
MIILFGFRKKLAILATLSMACPNGHVAAHRLTKITHWFTLFFIPTIPLSRKYFLTCIQCGQTSNLPKEHAVEMAANVASHPTENIEPISPPIPIASTNPNAALPPPGWYRDPGDPILLRFWDGTRWTEQVTKN